MKLRLENITKRFGTFTAIDNLNLCLENSEFLSMVGPSGCGKTTTLRLIAGFIGPDKGEIYFNDQPISRLGVRHRNVGIVFQNYALFPNMTACKNVAFGLKARRMTADQAHKEAMYYLELVGLSAQGDRYPRQLSGGQQQRVALARALAIRPSILLLDEPLSALDAKVRNNLRFEIKRIQRESGITTIYVTHDQEEALAISDRVALMERGGIAQIGTPHEIYNTPHNYFVADFVGVNNLLPVHCDASGIPFWQGRPLSVADTTYRGDAFVAVRPEHIIPCDLEAAGHNIIKSTITGRVFLGPLVRVALESQGHRLLMDLMSSEAPRYIDGQELTVTFHPDKGRVIPHKEKVR